MPASLRGDDSPPITTHGVALQAAAMAWFDSNPLGPYAPTTLANEARLAQAVHANRKDFLLAAEAAWYAVGRARMEVPR